MIVEKSADQDNEIAAQLQQQLSLSQSEVRALKQAHAQEIIRREQIGRELEASRQLLQLVMDTLPAAIFWKDQNLVYLGCNRNFAEDAGLASPENIIGKTDYDMPWKTEEADSYRLCDRRVILSDQSELGIVESQFQANGKQAWLETNKAPLKSVNGETIGILGTYQDITQRKQADISLQELNQKLEKQTIDLTAAMDQLQQSQLRLIQREKMSALGNLTAGVAHEMNNPLGFLSGNLKPAQAYVKDLFELIDLYQKVLPVPGQEIEDQIETIDLEYLREDLPKLLHSMADGIRRIRNISDSLRTFSRADTENKVPFNLHEGLDSTLLILKHRLKANEYRPAIEVVKHYDELPPIICFPGQLNQVFMNLLANAIDAIEEANRERRLLEAQPQSNKITITVRRSADQLAVVSIKDSGIGMTEATRQRVFENLFTTKAVGKGTGLGLAIAHQIVVEKHGGTIDILSTLGQGTEFIIQLPI